MYYDVGGAHPLFLEGLNDVFVGIKGHLYDGDIFISPIQQWIDGACESTCLSCQDLMALDNMYSHDQIFLCKCVMLLMYMYLIIDDDVMLRWFYWQYDYT